MRHEGTVSSVVQLADGRLASASHDHLIKLWRLAGLGAGGVCDTTLTGHTGDIHSMVLLADGRLASGAVDSTIRLWHPLFF